MTMEYGWHTGRWPWRSPRPSAPRTGTDLELLGLHPGVLFNEQ